MRPLRTRVPSRALQYVSLRAPHLGHLVIFLQEAGILSGSPSLSDGASRIAETAVLLSDDVFPDVRLRQWGHPSFNGARGQSELSRVLTPNTGDSANATALAILTHFPVNPGSAIGSSACNINFLDQL
jgi:hypothetical protein